MLCGMAQAYLRISFVSRSLPMIMATSRYIYSFIYRPVIFTSDHGGVCLFCVRPYTGMCSSILKKASWYGGFVGISMSVCMHMWGEGWGCVITLLSIAIGSDHVSVGGVIRSVWHHVAGRGV